jgi:hypothetical protein
MNMLVSTAAIASATLAASSALTSTNADLAVRLKNLSDRFASMSARDEKHRELCYERIQAKFGVLPPDGPSYDDEGYEEYNKGCSEIAADIDREYPHLVDPEDEHGCSMSWNEYHDELYKLCPKILETETRSLADLGLKAQAAALMDSPYWRDEAVDPQNLRSRMFIDAVCAFCGVDALPPTLSIVTVEDVREALNAPTEDPPPDDRELASKTFKADPIYAGDFEEKSKRSKKPVNTSQLCYSWASQY